MLPLVYLASWCTLFLGPQWALGHGVFLCPDPLTGMDINAMSPCGGGFRNSTEFLDIPPGPFSIKWIDTNKIEGALYRVTLKRWDRETEYCILQDRVPSSDCIGNVTEDGNNCTMEYQLTVNIPDVTCDNCYLQITTIAPNGTDCLVNLDSTSAECGPLYYTCANMRILGGSEMATLRQCQSRFLETEKEWPIRTANKTRKCVPEFRDQLGVFQYAFGSFNYKPITNSRGLVRYSVELWVGITILLKQVMIAWKSKRTWATYQPLTSTPTYGTFQGTLHASGGPNLQFLNDKWFIQITYKTNDTTEDIYEATYIPLVRSAEVYNDATGNYTDDGWLSGPEFDGPAPKFPDVIEPKGVCVPQPPTTTTEATEETTVYIETKTIPEDPVKKMQNRRRKTLGMFTRASGTNTQSWTLFIAVISLCVILIRG